MKAIDVSSLVRYLKNKLEADENLNNILVTGEISNYKKHSSNHLYFTLKDNKAAINCIMFAGNAKSLAFEPKNGDKVILSAYASIYEATGQLQLYVTKMNLSGLGDLYYQYEQLKKKLFEEGYFKEDHKKELEVRYPNRIAVLVGDNSAAQSDIKTTFSRRWPLCSVDYYPVLVQGKDAPKDIINNLLKVDELEYDAIILARGGGSFEDLFCFNDEQLIKVIYNLKTFIITGVGHQQDFTLVDFVADLRAATPTAAVELITPNIDDVIIDLGNSIDYLNDFMLNKYEEYEKNVNSLITNKYLTNPNLLIEKTELKIISYIKSLSNFSLKLSSINIRINNYLNSIREKMNNRINITKKSLDSYTNLLNAYSYQNTLKRGYSVVYKDNKIIKSKKKLKEHDLLNIKMYDGQINVEVKGENNG